jgi:hypothetical protein
LKTGFAVFLILLSVHQLRRLPLSKNSSFYSAAAIFFFFVNVLVFSALDISFSFFFLWAYITSIFFSVIKNRRVKILLISVSALPFYLLVYDTFFLAAKDFAGVLINSPLTGNFLLGCMFFPFLLMLIRVDFLTRHSHNARFGRGLKFLLGLTGGATLAALLFTLSFNPWSGSPQPLSVEEYAAPGEHALRLSSPSPLGNFTLSFGGENFSVDTGERTLELPLPAADAPLAHTIRADNFLARRTYSIAFSPPLKPEKITLALSSDTPLVVYDCNFPYSLDITGHNAEVFIGEDPPVPLELIMTFPADQVVTARLTSWSPVLSSDSEIGGKTFAASNYSKLVDSFIIKTDE